MQRIRYSFITLSGKFDVPVLAATCEPDTFAPPLNPEFTADSRTLFIRYAVESFITLVFVGLYSTTSPVSLNSIFVTEYG